MRKKGERIKFAGVSTEKRKNFSKSNRLDSGGWWVGNLRLGPEVSPEMIPDHAARS